MVSVFLHSVVSVFLHSMVSVFCLLCFSRRQKARERQQKLLAEFASRQKSFMETAMDVGEWGRIILR